jgi:hypothetical protein
MTLISPHFSLEEVSASDRADRLGIDNTPNAQQRANATSLAFNILEPIRAHYDRPLVPSSWLRVEALNAATPGASKTSQHCSGEAIDFRVQGIPVGQVTLWIAVSELPFDQLILEYASPDNPLRGWTHVSYGPRKRRDVRHVFLDSKGDKQEMGGLPVWVHSQFGGGGKL